MLSALELVGFKSFADKTRFEFNDGITVVVGPNGSGKSNIVDAIKWVLGSQSAKALRGSDMVDVIFKGSAAGGRKAANSAEATLFFDNTQKILDVDASEVSVTRRVYRSGESEYLINLQPCRLKDIRELFRGTGVGVDAYSLIEQGKVDRMLQASPKDRRAIFEEAAGISRFKAKKVEAERRLARVEQSLLRLSDIVDEVHSRLNSLKNQADKARRYREMTVRLAELRQQVGLAEQLILNQQRDDLKSKYNTLVEGQQEIEAVLKQAESNSEQQNTTLLELQSKHTESQQLLQNVLGEHAKLESAIESDTTRIQEFATERELLQSRLSALQNKAIVSSEEVQRSRVRIDDLESELDSQQSGLSAIQLQLDSAEEEFKLALETEQQLRTSNESLQSEIHLLQQSLSNDKARRQQAAESVGRIQQEILQLTDQRRLMDQDLAERSQQLQTLTTEAAEKQSAAEAAKKTLEDTQSILSDRQSNAVSLSGKLEGTRQRLSVLAELESQREGIAGGARQMIDMARENPVAPWNSVVGMVADLIEIDLQFAPLIDVALGAAAETVVLRDGQIVQMVREDKLPIDGRVSMIRLDRLSTRRVGERIQLDGLHGVLGRADRMVHCKEEFLPLIKHLLGTTWLIDTLDTALDLSHLRGSGLKFVTAQCERIDADGTLMLGTLQSALGLISRKSELQNARNEIQHLEYLSRESVTEIGRLKENIWDQKRTSQLRQEESQEANHRRSRLELEIESAKHRRDANVNQTERLESELAVAKQTEQTIANSANEAEEKLLESENSFQRLSSELSNAAASLAELTTSRSAARDKFTEQRVAVAKIEQRIESDRIVLDQLSRDHQERHAAVDEANSSLNAIEVRRTETQARIEESTNRISELAASRETLQVSVQEHLAQIAEAQQQRDLARSELTSAQHRIEKHRDLIAQVDAESNASTQRLTELTARYKDDYQIDLTDAEAMEQVEPPTDHSAAVAEINELRDSIASVGAVNMEALGELDELQQRYDTLHGHYTDLVESKESLQRVIVKINQDSRRLFMETLNAVRENFQQLYRKSFGGGSADIILEDGEDVLDCGVEIVATPPGKTELSNSLLSGGEKALTAVALIMSIFQFRPSPFCILDEVDAPFDEANIGRFVSVLDEFLDTTKFIIVTHSKKTMTSASTLYGVTMQESGVSKQVAVRFEEVGDDGSIHGGGELPAAA